jgi:hypothetical protein
MEVLYPRCAGLDVHKDSVVARIRCVSEPVHDEVNYRAGDDSCMTVVMEAIGSSVHTLSCRSIETRTLHPIGTRIPA